MNWVLVIENRKDYSTEVWGPFPSEELAADHRVLLDPVPTEDECTTALLHDAMGEEG